MFNIKGVEGLSSMMPLSSLWFFRPPIARTYLHTRARLHTHTHADVWSEFMNQIKYKDYADALSI